MSASATPSKPVKGKKAPGAPRKSFYDRNPSDDSRNAVDEHWHPYSLAELNTFVTLNDDEVIAIKAAKRAASAWESGRKQLVRAGMTALQIQGFHEETLFLLEVMSDRAHNIAAMNASAHLIAQQEIANAAAASHAANLLSSFNATACGMDGQIQPAPEKVCPRFGAECRFGEGCRH